MWFFPLCEIWLKKVAWGGGIVVVLHVNVLCVEIAAKQLTQIHTKFAHTTSPTGQFTSWCITVYVLCSTTKDRNHHIDILNTSIFFFFHNTKYNPIYSGGPTPDVRVFIRLFLARSTLPFTNLKPPDHFPVNDPKHPRTLDCTPSGSAQKKKKKKSIHARLPQCTPPLLLVHSWTSLREHWICCRPLPRTIIRTQLLCETAVTRTRRKMAIFHVVRLFFFRSFFCRRLHLGDPFFFKRKSGSFGRKFQSRFFFVCFFRI